MVKHANATSLLFPNGRCKAFTLSYDDGTSTDIRLAELMKKYGVHGTFNVCGGFLSPNDAVHEEGKIYHLSAAEIKDTFDDPCFEIATHGYTHPHLHKLPSAQCITELADDRRTLETITGDLVQGHAYPYGALNEQVVEAARLVGITYARTVEAHHTFRLPQDWLRWGTTCHHNDERLFALADQFIAEEPTVRDPWLFYVWGHSAEFQRDNNWDRMETLLDKIAGRNDIWYATNGEIYDYITAWNSLRYSADASVIYNPTATDLWLQLSQFRDLIARVFIPAGGTVHL